MKSSIVSSLFSMSLLIPSTLTAAPPFITDDPSPVGYHQMNIIPSINVTKIPNVINWFAPSLELDYGLIKDIEINLILSNIAIKSSDLPSTSGLADTQLGIKYRFVNETKSLPQIAFAPIFFLPTGDYDKGLGNGRLSILLPIWIQKSWGAWTSYGGGGYVFNPAPYTKNFLIGGLVVQKTLNETWTLGSEIFFQQASSIINKSFVEFVVGGYYFFNPNLNLMLSVGHNIYGQATTYGYLGLAWTI